MRMTVVKFFYILKSKMLQNISKQSYNFSFTPKMLKRRKHPS